MTLTLNLTQEEVRELFKEKLVETFPNYKIKTITYNVDPVYKGQGVGEYKTYEFISSVLIKANYEKLVRISNLKSVEYLSKPTKVSSQIYDAKKIINLENLTEHKYFEN